MRALIVFALVSVIAVAVAQTNPAQPPKTDGQQQPPATQQGQGPPTPAGEFSFPIFAFLILINSNFVRVSI